MVQNQDERDNPTAPKMPDPKAPITAFDFLASVCMALAGTALVVLVIIFGWLVYGRYILNDTPTWVEQLALLLIVWITFLGAAVGVHRNTHLSVDFIRESMPPRIRSFMRVLADLIVLSFGAAMVWQGYALVSAGMGRAVPMLGISEAWRVAAMPVCGALIAIFMIARLASAWRRQAGTKTPRQTS